MSGTKVAAWSGGFGGVGVIAFIVVKVALVALRTQGIGLFGGEMPKFFNAVIAVQTRAATDYNKVSEALVTCIHRILPT